jgi:excisionase family DNA binding protein
VPAPIRVCDQRRTRAAIVAQIDALLDEEHTDREIATILNERGLKTGAGDPFTATSVQWVRYAAHLESLRQRLRRKGMLTTTEISQRLGVHRDTVMKRLSQGRLRARKTNDNGRWVFWPLDLQPAGAADATTSGKTAANNGTAARGAV